MTRKHSPATMADKPARRMRVDAVTLALFSLIEVFPWVFIYLSPLLNDTDKCQSLAPGITSCLASTKYTLQLNVGSCRPHVWGFMWGYGKTLASVPGK